MLSVLPSLDLAPKPVYLKRLDEEGHVDLAVLPKIRNRVKSSETVYVPKCF